MQLKRSYSRRLKFDLAFYVFQCHYTTCLPFHSSRCQNQRIGVFADQVQAPVTEISCDVTPRIRRPRARDGVRPAGIKQRERSCRRWQQ
jgi:hypothetical protein